MKTNFLFILLLCAFIVMPTISRGQTAEDLQKIRTCLKSVEGKSYGDNCVGVVADPCIKSAFDNNDYNTAWDLAKQCAQNEYLVWLAILKDSSKKISDSGFPAERIAKAQKNRPAVVEDTCASFEMIRPEYSVGAANYCRLRETAFHALTLNWLRQAVTTDPHLIKP